MSKTKTKWYDAVRQPVDLFDKTVLAKQKEILETQGRKHVTERLIALNTLMLN